MLRYTYERNLRRYGPIAPYYPRSIRQQFGGTASKCL